MLKIRNIERKSKLLFSGVKVYINFNLVCTLKCGQEYDINLAPGNYFVECESVWYPVVSRNILIDGSMQYLIIELVDTGDSGYGYLDIKFA